MRKYFFILILSIVFFKTSHSQLSSNGILRAIDSLKKILPGLHDSARVDCLNNLAFQYSWSPKWSNETPDFIDRYAREANNFAKQIGYKKGIARSNIKLAWNQTFKIDNYIYARKKNDSVVIDAMADTAEQMIRDAILKGQDIHDNDILGEAYWCLAGVILSKFEYNITNKNEQAKYEEYLKKAISYYEKTDNEISKGCVYRDLFYIYQDRNDLKMTNEFAEKALSHFLKAGDDRMLGDFYFFNLRGFHMKRKDINAQENDLKNALSYYEKAGETNNLANAYNGLNGIYRQKSNLQGSEDLLKKGLSYFQKTGNEEGENGICIALSWFYISIGDFEKGFPYCERSIKLTEKLSVGDTKKQGMWGTPYFYMSRLYKYAGDYETALLYLHKCKKWYDEWSLVGNQTAEIGEIHRIMKNYDSANYYLKPFATARRSNSTALGITNLAKLLINLKDYDKAIPLIMESIEEVKKTNNSQNGFNYTALANAYLGKKNYQAALKSAREAQSLLKIEVHKIRMMENYEVLSEVFHSLGENDSAYYYIKQYTALKDSLLTRQFYWRLNNYKKTAEDERKISQINLLNKDNQLKEQKLKQQAYVKNSLTAGLIILFLLSVFIFRTLNLKRKNEKLRSENIQSELWQKAAELEMQALRAQMNPHFIFNCLSSINRFIIKNETEAASDYLTRFSRLIRMVLINSQKSLITLEDEIEMLRLYLDMERLRFKNSFDYDIHFKNTVDAGAIFIPPLLLQPFCENAIWHGLMHKDGRRNLDIAMNMQDKVLNCTITDNGVGRGKAAELKSKSAEKDKSMGLQITRERLALLNKDKGAQTSYTLEDLFDENGNSAGTKVNLKISCNESVEENA